VRKPNQVGVRPFKIPRHLPPEFWDLPLDLLREQSWPSWPYRIERGLRAYPSPNAFPLPISAGEDPISNAKQAVQHILAEGARLQAFCRAMAPVGDAPIGTAVKTAAYAGMEDVRYARTNPPKQSIPWQDHRGIWSGRAAVREFLSRLIYPDVPAGVVQEWLKTFDDRRRER
jgi:hypothetical protein